MVLSLQVCCGIGGVLTLFDKKQVCGHFLVVFYCGIGDVLMLFTGVLMLFVVWCRLVDGFD